MTIRNRAAALALLTLSTLPVPAQADVVMDSLSVLWVEVEGGCGVQENAVKAEVRRILGSISVEVDWRSGGPASVSSDGVVRVTLLSKDRTRRSHPPMGSALTKAPASVFVLCPEIVWTLKDGGDRWDRLDLSNAVGRVVAHELVHVLAPDLQHARFGLMAPSLTARALTQPGVSLDPATTKTLRARFAQRLASR